MAEASFITWDRSDPSSKATAMREAGLACEAYTGVNHAKANYGDRTFVSVDTDISVKSEYNRNDYDYYRRGENIPEKQHDIIAMAMKAYDRVGIVRHVVDLMADFSSQGINLVHPNTKQEDFYQNWFAKVNGKDRSERFLNMLYRAGNTIVWRTDGRISVKDDPEMRSAHGGFLDETKELEKVRVKHRVIPLQYTFFNPLSVEVVGGESAMFSSKPRYAVKLSSSLRNDLAQYDRFNNTSNTGGEGIPTYILDALKSGQNYLPLDPDKVSVFHYKKDDWKPWANPMVYAILTDLIHLKKLELADMSALDGAISNIRLWRLGSLEHEIMPTRAGINKVRNILANNVVGGVLDLVWGPELDFKESNSQVHRFLGAEKYKITLSKIYAGLGIPPSLTGVSTDGGFTNNYIAIKTLIERLEYGRDVLVQFWNAEIKRVQKAMGFRFPATVVFDQMLLSDEAAEKQLLLGLIDRDLISAESLRGKFDLNSDIEKVRINREHKQNQSGKTPPKASPFHNPQVKEDMKKIALQSGHVTNSQVGLDMPDKKPGEISPNDDRHQKDLEKAKIDGEAKIAQQKYKTKNNANGRPKNSSDKKKRKRKIVQPRTSAEFIDLMMWAQKAQAEISDVISPAILGSLGKKNARMLTVEEAANAENLKFRILCGLQPYEEINPEKVYNLLNEESIENAPSIFSLANELTERFTINNSRKPVIDENRQIQVSAYARFYEDN